MRLGRWIGLISLLIASAAYGDDETPAQAHDPTLCANEDKACILAWYGEFKDGILEEFDDYRQLEDRVAAALRLGDTDDANRMMRLALDNGWYRHNHWQFREPISSLAAGIDFNEYTAIVADCRYAIIDMKYMT